MDGVPDDLVEHREVGCGGVEGPVAEEREPAEDGRVEGEEADGDTPFVERKVSEEPLEAWGPDQRIVWPSALAMSSTARDAVRFSRSRIGFTSHTSIDRSLPEDASISIASCTSR